MKPSRQRKARKGGPGNHQLQRKRQLPQKGQAVHEHDVVREHLKRVLAEEGEPRPYEEARPADSRPCRRRSRFTSLIRIRAPVGSGGRFMLTPGGLMSPPKPLSDLGRVALDALHSVNASGEVSSEAARNFRRAIDRTPAAGREELTTDPERNYGAYGTLPETAQRTRRRTIARSRRSSSPTCCSW